MNEDEVYLGTTEAAEVLGVDPRTMRRWRDLGAGPAFFRLGSSAQAAVRYSIADLRRWLIKHREEPADD